MLRLAWLPPRHSVVALEAGGAHSVFTGGAWHTVLVRCQAPCQGLLTSWLDHHGPSLSTLEETAPTLPKNGSLRGKRLLPWGSGTSLKFQMGVGVGQGSFWYHMLCPSWSGSLLYFPVLVPEGSKVSTWCFLCRSNSIPATL